MTTPTRLEPKSYTVTATVQFSVTATSLMQAYKEFHQWMATAFNNSFDGYDESGRPVIAPSYFEGLSVTKDLDKTLPEDLVRFDQIRSQLK